jgi:hypothetical protein
MSTARQHHRTGLLAWAALLLVLLGVLAMHGVGGGHGADHRPVASSGLGSTPDVAGHHAPGPTAPTDPVAHLAADVADPTSWTALCLAILGGAVLLLLGRGTAVPTPFPPAPTALRTRLPGRRDRDPPSLIVLSVRRC